MLELLSPAGSREAMVAAVQSGADAVYLGVGEYNARRNAKNFSREEFAAAISYCHLRGVKVYLAMNTLLNDRELPGAAALVGEASALGVDAMLVQDLGLLRAARQVAPDLPLHASTQMSVHSLDGVRMAAELGFRRVVLARELSRDKLLHICKNAPIEVEVFVHGALCVSHSGQCYMSSVIGGRSGNRGLCAQPCRMPYRWEYREDAYLLSMKDLSLAGHLRELERMGVACVKIEGRMKRPEYVAIVTSIYAAAIREGREPTQEELSALKSAFSRQGFTDGYFTGKKDTMFGVREEPDPAETNALFSKARADYLNGECRRVPVRLYAAVRPGEPAIVGAEDPDGHRATARGPVPQKSHSRALTSAQVEEQLSKTGGTPFRSEGTHAYVEEGLSLPLSAINALRREALDTLSKERVRPPVRQSGVFQPGVRNENRKEPPVLTVSVSKWEQITPELLALGPAMLYVPASEFAAHGEKAKELVERLGPSLAVSMPRVVGDDELPSLARGLIELREMGVNQALSGNLGQIALLQAAGFHVRGDFGLNVMNSQTCKELKRLNLVSATVSFELRLAAIRDMTKCMDLEMIGYGRLPLMITEHCVIKTQTGLCACENANVITDRTGAAFPLMKADGCRNVVLNSKKLFLADREKDWSAAGLWALRLMFTTENPRECVRVFERYLGDGFYEPNDFTRGLYYRDVE